MQAVLSRNTALDCIASPSGFEIRVGRKGASFSGRPHIILREAVIPGFTHRESHQLPSGRDTPCRFMVTATDSSGLALSVQGLRKAYDDVVAVDGLDLQVRSGECF